MNSKEILAGNKLIAEFMGEKLSNSGLGILAPAGFDLLFAYHSSWDWLMPCWKKMGDYIYNKRGELSEAEYITSHRLTKQILDAFQKVELKSAWEILVEFIKLHNEKFKK